MAVTQGTSPANRDEENLQDHTWFNSLPTCSANTELSSEHPQKWGSQRNWGPAAQIPHRGSRLHKGKVRFGVFPHLVKGNKEKPPCPTTPQLQKNSPSRRISASPGVFHPHRDGSHRCWMPEHHHSSLHRQFPRCLPLSWQPACPQQLAARPARSCCSPPDLSSIITALLTVTLHPCVPAPARAQPQEPAG